MVASELISAINSFDITGYVGVEDFADKFNSIITVAILIGCTLIVTVRQYVMNPMSCYSAASPLQGCVGFEAYANNYCWTEGTSALPLDHQLSHEEMKKSHIAYYQWVPFVLALQCIMFYVPKVIWQLITYGTTGTDLQQFVAVANEATKADVGDDREGLVDQAADMMETMLLEHSEMGTGRRARWRKSMYDRCSLLAASKRLGNWISVAYLFIKCVYLANCIGQLYLMRHFLRLDDAAHEFGWNLLADIRGEATWRESMVFPRVTWCRLRIRNLGSVFTHVAQCSLTANMINEKIYIFLWFWVVVATTLTAGTLFLWFFRLANNAHKQRFFTQFITNDDSAGSVPDPAKIAAFTNTFLRLDGLFLLKMIAINTGDVVTAEIVRNLYRRYTQHYQGRNLFEPYELFPVDYQLVESNNASQPATESTAYSEEFNV